MRFASFVVFFELQSLIGNKILPLLSHARIFSLIFSLHIFSVKAEDEGSDGSCGAGEGASDQDNFTEEDSEQEEEEESNEATDALSSLIFIFSQIFLFSLSHLVWCLVSLSPFPFLNPYFPPPIFLCSSLSLSLVILFPPFSLSVMAFVSRMAKDLTRTR